MEKIPSQSPHGYCVFCEDIRQEVNGKFTYVGVFSGSEMNVLGAMPTNIGKFSISLYFAQRAREITGMVMLHVLLPGDDDDKPSAQMEVNMPELLKSMPPPPESLDDPFVSFRTAFTFNPLFLNRDGHIKVRAVLADAYISLGAIKVISRPPVAANPDKKEAAN